MSNSTRPFSPASEGYSSLWYASGQAGSSGVDGQKSIQSLGLEERVDQIATGMALNTASSQDSLEPLTKKTKRVHWADDIGKPLVTGLGAAMNVSANEIVQPSIFFNRKPEKGVNPPHRELKRKRGAEGSIEEKKHVPPVQCVMRKPGSFDVVWVSRYEKTHNPFVDTAHVILSQSISDFLVNLKERYRKDFLTNSVSEEQLFAIGFPLQAFFTEYVFSDDGVNSGAALEILSSFYYVYQQPVVRFKLSSLGVLDEYSKYLESRKVKFEPVELDISFGGSGCQWDKQLFQECMEKVLSAKLSKLTFKLLPIEDFASAEGIKSIFSSGVLPGLTELCLDRFGRGSQGGYSLQATDAEQLMEHVPNLRKLTLKKIDLSDSFLSTLAQSDLGQLQVLRLNDCLIEKGTGLTSLLSATSLENLRELVFPVCSEADEDNFCLAIEAMGKNESLQRLQQIELVDESSSFIAVKKIMNALAANEKFKSLNTVKLTIIEGPFPKKEKEHLLASAHLTHLNIETHELGGSFYF